VDLHVCVLCSRVGVRESCWHAASRCRGAGVWVSPGQLGVSIRLGWMGKFALPERHSRGGRISQYGGQGRRYVTAEVIALAPAMGVPDPCKEGTPYHRAAPFRGGRLRFSPTIDARPTPLSDSAQRDPTRSNKNLRPFGPMTTERLYRCVIWRVEVAEQFRRGSAYPAIWAVGLCDPASAYVLWSLGVNATPVGESVVSYRGGGCCGEVQRRGAG
jgi:hypothetical protein